MSARTISLLTHRRPEQTADAVARAVEMAEEAGVTIVADAEEREKHPNVAPRIGALEDAGSAPAICLVFGGDGTILKALRGNADSETVVYGVNFGTIGFLAASDRDEAEDGIRRVLTEDFEVMKLPALETGSGGIALNDVSFQRRPHGRVADLTFRLAGQEVGHVRCDGLVAATPAGSTGYNLANQGPILAWGVEGFVVSFIAPHTLTARPLVVAPDDVLTVLNAAGRDPVDLVIDGEHVAELESGEEMEIRFRDDVSRLAQVPGANFYRRIREKFGRLAQ